MKGKLQSRERILYIQIRDKPQLDQNRNSNFRTNCFWFLNMIAPGKYPGGVLKGRAAASFPSRFTVPPLPKNQAP